MFEHAKKFEVFSVEQRSPLRRSEESGDLRKKFVVPFEKRVQLHFTDASWHIRMKQGHRKLDHPTAFNFFLRQFLYF